MSTPDEPGGACPDCANRREPRPIIHRLTQIAYALRFREAPPIPPGLLPGTLVERLFAGLGPHDQRHLLEVHRLCQERGLPGPIVTGALLHDIGKARLSGARMSVAGRTWHVLFGRFAPDLERRLAGMRIPVISNELFIAYNHAAIGAERLEALGLPQAVCDAVRHHDDPNLTDPAMRVMQEIDSATP